MRNVTSTICASFKRHLGPACLVVCLFLCLTATAAACPGCKDALAANDSQQYQIARGYFWSILFMLSMPALIAGTFGTYVYIEVRRAKRDQGQASRSDAAVESLRDDTSVLST